MVKCICSQTKPALTPSLFLPCTPHKGVLPNKVSRNAFIFSLSSFSPFCVHLHSVPSPYSKQAASCNLLALAMLLRLGNSSEGERLCLPIPSMAMFVFHYLLNITSKYRNMVYVGLNDLCYSNISVSNHFLCIYPYLPIK